MKLALKYIFKQVQNNNISNEEAKEIILELAGYERKRDDIAIIGMACRFPEASTLEEFWINLCNGVDSIKFIPEQRKADINKFLEGWSGKIDEKEYREYGYLERIDLFDAEFFNIPPNEAKLMCPEQRLLLLITQEAFEDAGYTFKMLNGSRTGVYIGYSGSEYYRLIQDHEPLAIPGNLPAAIAGRIAYQYNLAGPAQMIDTACSSSLVALHYACSGLLSGDCDQAVVGGVRINLFPLNSHLFTNTGLASADGRSKAFDELADGTGGGEGVGVVILKPLHKALEDGDNIHAVIKGSAINSDGRSNGITAPNALAQAEVIKKAWERSGISPESISYIEAHGTGTKLGDPVEIEGLSLAFRTYTEKTGFCPIGSVKTNIGHLDSAAGVAGLIKVVLAMKHGFIPPSLHFKKPNPFINFDDSAVFVNNKLLPWDKNPKRAGISSFGLSGTNCHVVIEESPQIQIDERERLDDLPPYLFTLSAKSESSLLQLIERYNLYLQQKDLPDIRDICYTVNTCREHYRYCLALIIEDIKDLQQKLEKIYNISSNKGFTDDLIFYGRINETSLTDEKLFSNDKIGFLINLAQKYVNGEEIDWKKFYQGKKYNKVSLPVYPFELKRFWIEDSSTVKEGIEKFFCSINLQPGNMTENKITSDDPYSIDDGYNEIIQKVETIWSEVLGYETIDQKADFFELGGNSLSAMQIIAKLQREFGVKLPLSAFLEKPTIQEMSGIIINKHSRKNYHSIPVHQGREYYPLSSAQKRLYLICQHNPQSVIYNMPGVLEIEGPLDLKRFEYAINQLIIRQQVFRTSFEIVDGEIQQKISQEVNFHIQYEESNKDIEDLIKKFIRPFNLEEAPLFRMKIIKRDPEKYLLLYDVHHIISDGVSLSIMLKELNELYQGNNLDPLTIQYTDYVLWQRDLLKKGELIEQEKFWLSHLKGEIPQMLLPGDYFLNGVNNDRENCIYSFDVQNNLVEKIREIANTYDTTPFVIFLSAYYLLLAKYTGQKDIIVGVPVAGRTHNDLENLIGMFVNTLPLRNYPSPEKRVRDFITEVKTSSFTAFENQDYPLELIIEKLGVSTDLNQNTLFKTIFVIQNFDKNISAKIKSKVSNQATLALGNLQMKPYPFIFPVARFDLTLSGWEVDKSFYFEFEYTNGLFKEEIIKKMAEDFIDILIQVIEDNKKLIKDIELKTDLIILPIQKKEDEEDGDFDF